MKCHYWLIYILSLLLLYAEDLHGQSWNFIKEKDGIKIYTRKELNSSLKAFRGEITFQANIDKVNLLIGDANNLDWWIKDVSNIKVLNFQKDKFVQYYLVYKVPWPLSNRDLVVDAQISSDPLTGVRIVIIKPLPGVVMEKPGLIRIKEYWQKWTIQPIDKGYVHIILEGFVDPNGNVPFWLYNLFVSETPYKILQALRARALSDKPAMN